jgi:hypothetical protein
MPNVPAGRSDGMTVPEVDRMVPVFIVARGQPELLQRIHAIFGSSVRIIQNRRHAEALLPRLESGQAWP